MIAVDTVEVFDVEQGGDEWAACRLGMPTASRFADVMAGGRGGEASKTRTDYLYDLAGERHTGIPAEAYRSKAMERGSAMEPEIRSQYRLLTGHATEPVGFVRRMFAQGWAGCSPDSFVADNMVIEYKSLIPRRLIELYKTDRIPPAHIPQCQGAMLITGRPLCELVIGYGSMPLWRRLIPRDPSYQARLTIAINAFNEELAAEVVAIENYGRRPAR